MDTDGCPCPTCINGPYLRNCYQNKRQLSGLSLSLYYSFILKKGARFTVGGSVMAHFADKYCSVDSKLLRTQTTQKVAVAFIFVVFAAARHNYLNHM